MKLNNKGQIAFAVIALLTVVIGVFLVDQLCAPWCNCVDGTAITDTAVYVNEWQNHTCDGVKCDTDYTLTCNGTELEAGVDYSISSCDYRLDQIANNNSVCVLEYTYEGENYHGEDITGLVVCNIPLIALILGFVVAGGYALMKGF